MNMTLSFDRKSEILQLTSMWSAERLKVGNKQLGEFGRCGIRGSGAQLHELDSLVSAL